jgi:hypothetical protein
MKYLLSQLQWREEGERGGMWYAPHSSDKLLDLRPLSAQAKTVTPEGYVLIATERDPLPGETLLASAFNESRQNHRKRIN